MKVVYTPGPGEPEEIEAFGHVFVAGEGIDISEEKHLEKMRGNPSFRVGNEKPEREAGKPSEDDKRLTKALDGRSKAAREARAKADEAEAEAAAAERAQEHVEQIAASRNSLDK